MPLAFDLIWTLVSGWIFPVATTERARSPFSTVARREASSVLPLPRAASTPNTSSSTTARPTMPSRRLRFLWPFPLPFAILTPFR
jgi:hypothetical protein